MPVLPAQRRCRTSSGRNRTQPHATLRLNCERSYQEKFYFSPGDTGIKVVQTKFAKIGEQRLAGCRELGCPVPAQPPPWARHPGHGASRTLLQPCSCLRISSRLPDLICWVPGGSGSMQSVRSSLLCLTRTPPRHRPAAGCLICWDQWFPEGARCAALQGAEVIVYPTAIGSEPPNPQYNRCWPCCWRRCWLARWPQGAGDAAAGHSTPYP